MSQERELCKECGAYDGHAPECSLIDFITAKKMLKQYYRTWLEMELKHRKYSDRLYESIKKAKKEAEFWKGKFNTVKIENNSIRKKIIKPIKPESITNSSIEQMAEEYDKNSSYLSNKKSFIAGCKAIIELNKKALNLKK